MVGIDVLLVVAPGVRHAATHHDIGEILDRSLMQSLWTGMQTETTNTARDHYRTALCRPSPHAV